MKTATRPPGYGGGRGAGSMVGNRGTISNNDKVAAMFIENWKWSAQHLATAAAAMSPSGRENDQGWFLVHDSWTNNTGLAFVRTGQLGNYESGEFLFN